MAARDDGPLQVHRQGDRHGDAGARRQGRRRRSCRIATDVAAARTSSSTSSAARRSTPTSIASYEPLGTPFTAMDYQHQVIDHTVAYVQGNVHTNNIENFWSLLKRGLRGTYISVEPFHLFRYLDEQMFRFNEREADRPWSVHRGRQKDRRKEDHVQRTDRSDRAGGGEPVTAGRTVGNDERGKHARKSSGDSAPDVSASPAKPSNDSTRKRPRGRKRRGGSRKPHEPS